MSDMPAVPPAGTLALFPVSIQHTSGGNKAMHGLLVGADGRLVLAYRGAGFAARLEPEDALALGSLLLAIGAEMAAKREAAADHAAARLDAIVTGGSAH